MAIKMDKAMNTKPLKGLSLASHEPDIEIEIVDPEVCTHQLVWRLRLSRGRW
jgi:hypothetical protein